MEKFHVQLIVGPFQVNHIAEGESLAEVREEFFEDYMDKLGHEDTWRIEDSLIKVESITMIRVSPYVEQSPEQPSK